MFVDMKSLALSSFKYIATMAVSFLAPILWAFLFVIILVVIDTVTGMMKAGKKDVKEITSKKAFPIIPKLIFYFCLVVTAHACSFVEPDIPFVKLSLVGIGFIEVKSIDENFNEMFGYSFIDKVLEGFKALTKIKRK